jgi:hypothetical protein
MSERVLFAAWRILGFVGAVAFITWGIHLVRKGHDFSAALDFTFAAGWIVELNSDKAIRDFYRERGQR